MENGYRLGLNAQIFIQTPISKSKNKKHLITPGAGDPIELKSHGRSCSAPSAWPAMSTAYVGQWMPGPLLAALRTQLIAFFQPWPIGS
jgi:hypothetical protein